MSLVPILYTSIILFSILMIVIISTSYIAYKVRNRNNNDEEEVRDTTHYLKLSPAAHQQRVNRSQQKVYQPQQKAYQPQQTAYRPQQQAIKVVQAIKTPELRRTDLQPVIMSRTTVLNQNEYNRETKSTHDIIDATPPARTQDYSRRTNAASYKSRLEIINKIIPKESMQEKFTVSGSGSIALPKYYENFRAIQYYSDEDDEYLYKPSRHYS